MCYCQQNIETTQLDEVQEYKHTVEKLFHVLCNVSCRLDPDYVRAAFDEAFEMVLTGNYQSGSTE